MIPYEEAFETIINNSRTLGKEQVNFRNSLNRVLAENVYSDINMPPFNKSAMDGYACRKSDLANPLEVIETIAAGVWPKKIVGKNQCAKIMTGAPLPKGADTVIMVEYTENIDANHIIFTKKDTKPNICITGEDIKSGDKLLRKGTLIKPKHIPVMATAGATDITVYKQPRVAVISTGDELVEPEETPGLSKIRNSNAWQLMAQTQALGIPSEYLGISHDSLEETQGMLQQALHNADVVILSGAVSMGDYDFVPLALKESGFDIRFHGVATKPGKKTIFATNNKKWVVGVPGNPVSSFVQFELLIKPLLMGIMGNYYKPTFYRLPIAIDYKRKNAKRKSFEPVVINPDGKVTPVAYHGSAHINALSYSDGLMAVEIGQTQILKGELVDVRPI